MRLAETIYRICSQLPREETYGMRQQLTRAAVSIPANIAEGQARHGTGEFLHFLGVARGSLAELETLLTLCERLNLLNCLNVQSALSDCAEIGKLLNGLIKSLRG
ncbi:MAG TPA: four helix bundle protein [Accumulibacter sp.]|nr:four helix bundle protein [Accumulibacter sp.]